jgi:hypothetical protein
VKPRGWRRWWGELPRVFFFTAVALPFVAPAALVIVASLLLFLLLEGAVWLVLLGGRWVRLLFHRPSEKQLNAPTFEWRQS